MKLSYDNQADALWVSFAPGSSVEQIEVHPNVVIDLDENGKIVAIEILYVSETVAPGFEATAVAAE